MRFSLLLVGLALVAHTPSCSSSDPVVTHDGGKSTPDASGGGTDAAAVDSGGVTTPLAAPQLTTVAKMMGALHVMWTNKEPACDTVEGERKTATSAYAVAFTVPGEADNRHDTGAAQNTTYTYRLRCKKGSVYSAYSNEMSGNPQ